MSTTVNTAGTAGTAGTGTTTGLDTEALRAAVEGTDAEALVALYADDAVITSVDRDHPPRAPRSITGKDAVRAHLDAVFTRDLAHRLQHVVVSGSTAAFSQACTYADGTQVLCLATVETGPDGRIVRQLEVSAWDA